MKYFVTGATGFVGGALVRKLRAAGHDVNALVRNPRTADPLAALGVTIFKGDITNRRSLSAPMEGVDGIFHVAGWYKLDANDRAEAWRVNVAGTRNVLESMGELQIPRGVYTSTLAIFSDTHGRIVDENYYFAGRHLTIYDESKWAAHYQVAGPLIKDGLPLTVVLPGLVYGPGDTSQMHETFDRLLTGRLRAIPQRTAYSFGYIDDIVDGHILAMERGSPGDSYIIAGPPYTLEEVMEKAAAIAEVKLPRLRPGPLTMKATGLLVSALDNVVPVPSGYESGVVKSTAGVTYLGSNAKARTELGYAPRSIEDGLAPTLCWESNRESCLPK